MRLRVPFVAVLAVALSASSTHAAPRTWYDNYLEAKERLIPNKEYRKAIANLEQAVKVKPDSALEEQTYGLEFIDYLPYFYQAKCYLALGDYDSAIRFLNLEQAKGKIQRSDKWTEWNKLRRPRRRSRRARRAKTRSSASRGKSRRSAPRPSSSTRRETSTTPWPAWPRRRSWPSRRSTGKPRPRSRS